MPLASCDTGGSGGNTVDGGLASSADQQLQAPPLASSAAPSAHHDNEPADLPALGEPLKLKLRTGVRYRVQ